MSTSSRSSNAVRHLALGVVLLLHGACALDSEVTLAGCKFGNSEAYKLKARIGQAHQELTSKGTGELSFTHDIRIDRPYVVVLLPRERVSSESVRSAELPLAAKELIQSHIEHSDLPGPVLGLVQAERSEWHPLPDDVSVSEMLYAWKQTGEGVSVTITRRQGATAVTRLR